MILIRVAIAFAALLCCVSAASAAPIDIDGPTTIWTAIDYPGLIPDFNDDQQAGAEGDIVGNALRAALYIQFDDGGTTGNLIDGNIAFRLRLGSEENPAGFSRFAAVGMDADGDGAIDIFIGVDNSGSADRIEIYNAGPGANTSPDTTTIESASPALTYTQTATNYSWDPIDATIEPGESLFDLDGPNDGTHTDYFLSWSVPFNAIVTLLGSVAHNITIDENTPVQYVAGTSQQDNALNQDLGGPDGGTNSSQTWADLGALSNPITATGVPEPSSLPLLLLGLLGLAAARARFSSHLR
jgi:hypothetical protein